MFFLLSFNENYWKFKISFEFSPMFTESAPLHGIGSAAGCLLRVRQLVRNFVLCILHHPGLCGASGLPALLALLSHPSKPTTALFSLSYLTGRSVISESGCC